MQCLCSFLKQEFDILYSLPQGYTPLHLAMQYSNEDIYNLLVQAYGKWGNNFNFYCLLTIVFNELIIFYAY
jgi:ankyrin repeat protein